MKSPFPLRPNTLWAPLRDAGGSSAPETYENGRRIRYAELFCDAACKRTGRGQSGWGAVIVVNGKAVKKWSGTLGIRTVPEAEILAIARGLEATAILFREPVEWRIRIHTDSKIALRYWNKSTLSKRHLRQATNDAKEAGDEFDKVVLRWSSRRTDAMRIADNLAGQVIGRTTRRRGVKSGSKIKKPKTERYLKT